MKEASHDPAHRNTRYCGACDTYSPQRTTSSVENRIGTQPLYAGILSFGKASELAKMTLLEFGILLGKRNIPRQYDETDLQDDIAYASDLGA